jgi:hypothetical protein
MQPASAMLFDADLVRYVTGTWPPLHSDPSLDLLH